jgi:acyl-CoA thioester hydrolase
MERAGTDRLLRGTVGPDGRVPGARGADAARCRHAPTCLPLLSPVAGGQHVNNVEYFGYCQAARLSWMRALAAVDPALDGLRTARHRPGVILADAYCRYKAPLTFPDDLLVGVETAMAPGPTETTITQSYRILSRASGRVAAEGHAKIVVFDYVANRRAPIPESFRRAATALVGPGLLVLDVPLASGPIRLTAP